MRVKKQAELDLAKAVLDALSGDTVMLKTYAQGYDETSSVASRIGKLLES